MTCQNCKKFVYFSTSKQKTKLGLCSGEIVVFDDMSCGEHEEKHDKAV